MVNWSNLETFLELVAFFTLLSSLFIHWKNIAFSNNFNFSIVGRWLLSISNISIFIILANRWFSFHYFPISNLYESLLFLTWSLTAVSLFLEYQTRFQILTAIALPISIFILAFASLSLPEELQRASSLVPALQSNWLMLHVSVMMISYATLMLGSLMSILFLVLSNLDGSNLISTGLNQNTFNKFKRQKFLTNFQNVTLTNSFESVTLENEANSQPSEFFSSNRTNLLESLDNLSYRTIGFGFPLLTIGIISGAVWANEAWGSYWSWDPKETWALVTWLIFASYLHARITKSWQGRKPAILASIGFAVVWVCYLGVNFLGKGLHSYGWVS